jgi:hypothetical protein
LILDECIIAESLIENVGDKELGLRDAILPSGAAAAIPPFPPEFSECNIDSYF